MNQLNLRCRNVFVQRTELLIVPEILYIAVWFNSFYIWNFIHNGPCQHVDGYTDGRSQIKVHTDERTQVHSAWSSLTVTHPSTNRGRRCSNSVNVPLRYSLSRQCENLCFFIITIIIILLFVHSHGTTNRNEHTNLKSDINNQYVFVR